ncbi:cation diffusion facilitator family transporter [Salegentibacter sp. F188]|uniref:Cation diffusion facilitator family transporter n=1 Tax=Autumnicola patrickiae TaxID=3075591 RepID=A0ABU3E4V9_9FLAO|nr:cation diffusion facilitator family transporter [Salegentibacter sp. F188]MDT0690975.1 cation diffusion facilitator family transporter [Salegentibacter sp. F188]
MKDQQREKNLKKGRNVQTFNIIYDSIEVGVSLVAGFSSGSSALIGWGLDSVVEVISGSTLWWRLNGELKDISEEKVKKRERITLFVIALSFLLISIFITYDSVLKLINKETPDWSTLGLTILLVSLVVNPFLIWYKYKYGKRLNSKELIADSKDTFVCLYQTIAVLGGILAVHFLDWWWADPAAALLIVPYALKEGWEAYNNGKKVKAQ